jgi:hypothetical protein
MNEATAIELNENIKRLLGMTSKPQAKKKKTREELIEEQDREIELRFLTKRTK